MPLQVIDGTLMISDRSAHHARSVGDARWVVSFLPGRTLSTEEATAAMQIAESVAENLVLARRLGLTVLEAFGLAVQEPEPGEVLRVRARRGLLRSAVRPSGRRLA
ncbi:hypothetical protein [Nocardia lijiangensis]|uniref:hypothetical protein n=1 Tax=Nocardia lijiangensis TaxID=299618 RepID=UPI003D738F9B